MLPRRRNSNGLQAMNEHQPSGLAARQSREPGALMSVPAEAEWQDARTSYTGVLRPESVAAGAHSCCRSCGQPLGYWGVDWLTGLLDRWGWDDHAPRIHNRACQQQTPIALLAIDLDRFKRINDEHGHPAGDLVLQSAAVILRQATRTTDLVSRYGGDEFVVLAPDVNIDGALALSKRIHDGIRATVTAAQSTYGRTATIADLTASVGIAVQYPEHSLALYDLLLHADAALRHAKSLGRDLICTANATPHAETTNSLPESA